MKTFITYLVTLSLIFTSSLAYATGEEGETNIDPETEDVIIAQQCFEENICTDKYMQEERTYSTVMLYLSALASFAYIGVCAGQASSVTYHSVALVWLIWEIINNAFIKKKFDTTDLLTNKETVLGDDSQLQGIVENIKTVNIAKQELNGKIQRANFLKWGWIGAGVLAGIESFQPLTFGFCPAESTPPNKKNSNLYFALLNPNNQFQEIDWSNPIEANFRFQELQDFYNGGIISKTNDEYYSYQKSVIHLPFPKIDLTKKEKEQLSQTITNLLLSSAYATVAQDNFDKLGLVRDSGGKYDRLVAQIALHGWSTLLLGTAGWKITGASRAAMIAAHVIAVNEAKNVFKDARDQLQNREDALRLLLRDKQAILSTDPSIDLGGDAGSGASAPEADQYEVPDISTDIPGGCAVGPGQAAKMDASCECAKTNTCTNVDIPIISELDGFDVSGVNGNLGELNSLLNKGLSGTSSASTLAGVDLSGKAAAAAKKLKELDNLIMEKDKKAGKKPSSIIAQGYKHHKAMVNSIKEKWPMLDANLKEELGDLAPIEKNAIKSDEQKKKNSEVAAVNLPDAGGANKAKPFKLKFGKDLNQVKGSNQNISEVVVTPIAEANTEVINAANEKVYDGTQDDIWFNSEGNIWEHISWRYKKSAIPKLDLE